MNRLQIVQRLRQEASVAGSGPQTLAGLTGEMKRLSDWADAAWVEIQGMAMWDWRWVQPTLTLPALAATIPGALPAGNYVRDSMRAQPAGRPLVFLPWQDFRERFPGAAESKDPSHWSVAPDGSLRFNSAPAADLALTVEAYANPAPMVADTDVPSMPEHLRIGIVWLALQKYASFEEAGSLYQTAEREWQKVNRQMERDYTPAIEMGGALC